MLKSEQWSESLSTFLPLMGVTRKAAEWDKDKEKILRLPGALTSIYHVTTAVFFYVVAAYENFSQKPMLSRSLFFGLVVLGLKTHVFLFSFVNVAPFPSQFIVRKISFSATKRIQSCREFI